MLKVRLYTYKKEADISGSLSPCPVGILWKPFILWNWGKRLNSSFLSGSLWVKLETTRKENY